MIDSQDEPSELESDEPPVKVSSDVPESTKAPRSIMFDPVRDLGVSSGGPNNSQVPKEWTCSNQTCPFYGIVFEVFVYAVLAIQAL